MKTKSRVNFYLLLFITFTILLVSACSSAVSQDNFKPAELKPGEAANFADLLVRFNTVIEDSRCPADATCLQGGEARISVTVSVTGEQEELELVLIPDGGSPASFQGYLISFTDLQPFPLASVPTNPNNYIATIQVSHE